MPNMPLRKDGLDTIYVLNAIPTPRDYIFNTLRCFMDEIDFHLLE